MREVEPSVLLLSHTPEPELLIERAGRTCYKSEGRITEGSSTAFIKMLLSPSRRHESVLEHASATFLIQTDRGISHELVRHRLASYSQVSTRYVQYKNEICVLRPSGLGEAGGLAYSIWRAACRGSEWAYFALLALGLKPEVARSVLPTCLSTELVMTANFREWRHFLSLRLASGAHPDMRIIAGLIRDELVKIAPAVFEEFTVSSNKKEECGSTSAATRTQ